MSNFLIITAPAKKKIAFLVDECVTEDLAFRAKVIGGGCQGMQYVFELHEKQANDWVMHCHIDESEFMVVMDPISGQYLQGSTIDFESSLTGDQFIIKNPNAQTSCSCGSSFSDE